METNVEFSEELLEPLIITEDGDSTTEDAMLQSCGEDASAPEKKEEHPGEEENDETHSEELKLEKQQRDTEEEHSDQHKAGVDGESSDDELNFDKNESEEKTQGSETKEEKTEVNRINSYEKQPEGEKHQEDTKKVGKLCESTYNAYLLLLTSSTNWIERKGNTHPRGGKLTGLFCYASCGIT